MQSLLRVRRPLAIGFGLFATVAPNRIVEPAERLAFEDPDVGRLRPSTLPIARLKGLAFVWLLARRSREASALRTVLAGSGALLALAPRSALAAGLRITYENPDELEVKPWVVPTARLLGACYLAAALFAGRGATPVDDSATTAGGADAQ